MADSTREEQEQRVEALRREVHARPTQPQEAICEAIGTAVADAIGDGHFTEHLRQAGWALVHVGDGTCPPAPSEWTDNALNLMDPGWIDPLAVVEQLWRAAWTAGHQVGVDAAEGREP